MAKKSRKPGRPKGTGTTGTGVLIGVRAHSPFLDAVDKWRQKQQVPPARAAAVRRLAEIGLDAEMAHLRAARRDRAATRIAASQASQMAGQTIDNLSDHSAGPEERERRKRRLLKGPGEFRELRADIRKRNPEE